ncbi:MAG: UDP-3-O-[3-hydroxymyristoyl] N-acetylglucosamine deacetylase, partial [Flavobacteriales bacterium]|nr:UDP-3-O-[3-hydroxymyristoyl] N-acetylglucosamine deacetylase [Flavobacteriales bacterium]
MTPKLQKTIQNSVSISGVGIHTGVFTTMTLVPAEANTGIRFIRTDLEENPAIKADIDNVFSTDRSTGLKKENAEINTVEHILAAVVGAEIDNLIIEVDNIEIPILDGSAKDFSILIEKAGIRTLNVKKHFFEIKRKISYTDKETGTTLIATPSDEYQIDVEIDYNSETLGVQNASLDSITDFNNEISASRTFCFLHELEVLLESNLIKGGDVNNAIIVVENEIPKEKLAKLGMAFNRTEITVNKKGYL